MQVLKDSIREAKEKDYVIYKLKGEIISLKEQRKEIICSKECQDARQMVFLLENNIKKLSTDLSTMQTNESVLKTQLAQSKSQVDKLKSSVAILTTSEKQLKDEVNIYSSRYSFCNDGEKGSKESIKQLQLENLDLQEKLETCLRKIEKLEILASSSKKENELEINQLIINLRQKDEELAKIRSNPISFEDSGYKKRDEELARELEIKNEELELIRDRNFDLEEKIATLQVTLEEFERENAQIR